MLRQALGQDRAAAVARVGTIVRELATSEEKLTSAQRPAWNAYAGKVLQLVDDVARNRNALRFPKGPAPEQLDFVAQTLRNRTTAVSDATGE